MRMRIAVSSLPVRRLSLLALVVLLGVAVNFAATSVTRASSGHTVAAKKKCKKKKAPPVVVPPATPQPLTDDEILNRVASKAADYCGEDPDCNGDSRAYEDPENPGHPDCEAKSTFSATCYGFYGLSSGMFAGKCDFREVVERDGVNGIKSHLDTSFGTVPGGGFACFLVV
jgi:hypothetical protein